MMEMEKWWKWRFHHVQQFQPPEIGMFSLPDFHLFHQTQGSLALLDMTWVSKTRINPKITWRNNIIKNLPSIFWDGTHILLVWSTARDGLQVTKGNTTKFAEVRGQGRWGPVMDRGVICPSLGMLPSFTWTNWQIGGFTHRCPKFPLVGWLIEGFCLSL